MAVAQRPLGVRSISVEQALSELRQKVAVYERIYEVSSCDMSAALARGERVDTAEVAFWMVAYDQLQQILQPTK